MTALVVGAAGRGGAVRELERRAEVAQLQGGRQPPLAAGVVDEHILALEVAVDWNHERGDGIRV